MKYKNNAEAQRGREGGVRGVEKDTYREDLIHDTKLVGPRACIDASKGRGEEVLGVFDYP